MRSSHSLITVAKVTGETAAKVAAVATAAVTPEVDANSKIMTTWCE